MKQILSLCIAFIMLLSLCACSDVEAGAEANSKKAAYDAASNVYDSINNAYLLIDEFGSDLYEAWRIGIYDDDEVSISYLADELNLSEDEITAAIDSLAYEGCGNYYFDYYEDSLFSACVWLVTEAYELNGTSEKIAEYLTDAKTRMKEMSEKYSDYEHYENLKSYYTTTTAFYDFCKDPSGSFEQVKETINTYRNDARSYRNDLSFIFED